MNLRENIRRHLLLIDQLKLLALPVKYKYMNNELSR